MKRDLNGRFEKKNIIELSVPSISFIIKYFLILIILLPWIHFGIYKLNVGKKLEELPFYIFGDPDSCENGRISKNPY